MLFITDATLPDGRQHQRLLIDQGRFVAIGPDLPTPEGAEVIDAAGWLLSLLRRRALPHGRDAEPGCRGSTSPARCWKASRCGAS